MFLVFFKKDKTDDVKDSFYKEVERVFDTFPKYQMKMLLGEINAKVGKHSTGSLPIEPIEHI
jgi:hypothetical protein